jgi:hypothetical protein
VRAKDVQVAEPNPRRARAGWARAPLRAQPAPSLEQSGDRGRSRHTCCREAWTSWPVGAAADRCCRDEQREDHYGAAY